MMYTLSYSLVHILSGNSKEVAHGMALMPCPFSYTIIDYNHGSLTLKLPKPKQTNHTDARLENKLFFIFIIQPIKTDDWTVS